MIGVVWRCRYTHTLEGEAADYIRWKDEAVKAAKKTRKGVRPRPLPPLCCAMGEKLRLCLPDRRYAGTV